MSAEAIPDPALELRATCAHEAAHAVIGLALGLPARRVVVLPGLRAFCTFSDPALELESVPNAIVRMDLDDPTRRPVTTPAGCDLPAVLVMLLAGERAGYRVRGQRSTVEGWFDTYEAGAMLGHALKRPAWGAEVHHILEGITRAADAAVRVHWDWIQAVAGALLARRVLTADEVRALRPVRERT